MKIGKGKRHLMLVMNYLTCLFFLLVLLCSCSDSAEKTYTDDSSAKTCLQPDAINPNGTSELAALMRQMAEHTEQIKIKIGKEEPLDAFPESFRKIHTATPTDSTVHNPIFNSFATHYISSLEKLYISAGTERTNTFNAMVNSCISCHNAFCKGPVKRINKMFLFPIAG